MIPELSVYSQVRRGRIQIEPGWQIITIPSKYGAWIDFIWGSQEYANPNFTNPPASDYIWIISASYITYDEVAGTLTCDGLQPSEAEVRFEHNHGLLTWYRYEFDLSAYAGSGNVRMVMNTYEFYDGPLFVGTNYFYVKHPEGFGASRIEVFSDPGVSWTMTGFRVYESSVDGGLFRGTDPAKVGEYVVDQLEDRYGSGVIEVCNALVGDEDIWWNFIPETTPRGSIHNFELMYDDPGVTKQEAVPFLIKSAYDGPMFLDWAEWRGAGDG